MMALRFHSVLRSKKVMSTYSSTVLLPKSSFPIHMKPDERIELDKNLAAANDVQAVYERQLCANPNKPLFILLDGPPYANGDVHIGHAVNKILKDIIVRYKIMTGHRVHFRPGWDCHGLPVELKAAKSLTTGESRDPISVRTAARRFAEDAIAKQMNSFKEWAILGDWSNRYATFDSHYQSTELRMFKDLYESGLIFRAFKPVYWSPAAETALAEAELEYCTTHRSLAVYFTMLTINFPKGLFALSPTAAVWAVVWTTTPWTLPVNDAICYNSNFQYCLVTLERERPRKTRRQLDYYLIGLNSLERFQSALKRPAHVVCTFPGTLLRGLLYSMPLLPDLAFPFYPGAHVDSKQGTSLVHTTFAHGFDDFNVGVEHGRQIQSFVDEQGRYTRDLGPPLWGKDVMTDGQDTFLATYPRHVLAREEVVHSYPYDWRSGKPVIIRSSKQWFVDSDRLKQWALDALREVSVFPPNHANSMVEMMSRRPLWCISRQRVWGTPVPVLYRLDSDEPLAVGEVVDHVIRQVERHGWDAWWTREAAEFLPDKFKNIPVRKSDEVLDVWFDSGLSWAAVLGGGGDDDKPHADLVVEGLDQLRGWFQSLLLTSAASRRRAPYRHVIVHGFVQDDQGRKMSKSAGNVVAPDVFLRGGTLGGKNIGPLGVDGLRLWVALYGSDRTNIPVGESSIAAVRSTLVQIRSVLRFLSGVLHDFDSSSHSCFDDQLSTVDRYMLRALSEHVASMRADLERYRIVSAMTKAVHFINGDVSNFYCTTVKNRLYCCSRKSVTRRSAQTVLHTIASACVRTIAPILPNLAEEYRQHVAGAFGKSVLESGWPHFTDVSCSKEEEGDFKVVLSARARFLAAYGSHHTMQYHLAISSSAPVIRSLLNVRPESELADLFRVSSVELKENLHADDETIVFSVSPSALMLCPRCKRFTRSDIEDLCPPCAEACND